MVPTVYTTPACKRYCAVVVDTRCMYNKWIPVVIHHHKLTASAPMNNRIDGVRCPRCGALVLCHVLPSAEPQQQACAHTPQTPRGPCGQLHGAGHLLPGRSPCLRALQIQFGGGSRGQKRRRAAGGGLGVLLQQSVGPSECASLVRR